MSNPKAMELLKEREVEGYEELGRLSYDDPMRGKVLNELTTYSSIRVADEQIELTRTNNDARNAIDEQKVVIEAKKVRTDGAKIASDIGKAVLYLAAGIGTSFMSYGLDTWYQKYPPLQRFGERLTDLITKK